MEASSPWTEEVCQFLRDHWTRASRGALANMIGERFGIRVTRNAVIGKGIRLGLEKKASTIAPVVNLRAERAAKPVEKKTVIRIKKPTAENPESFEPRVVDTSPLHLTILQLTDETCKYECSGSSEPRDYTFCGHETFPGMPYCGTHCRIAYIADNRKRARA